MKKLTAAQIQAEIVKRNAQFKDATKSERRVLIAKDVIQLIKDRKITLEPGVWVDTYSTVGDAYDKSLQQEFLAGNVECNCCGIGAMMLSCTLFKNKTKVGDDILGDVGRYYDSGDKFMNGFRELFSKTQVRLIELAFEQGTGWYCDENTAERKAVAFGEKYWDDEDRLTAIMTNIIKNDGKFIPPDSDVDDDY